MTVQDMIDQVRARTGESFSRVRACQIINDALLRLSSLYETAAKRRQLNYTAERDGHEFMIDCIGILRVEHDGKQVTNFRAMNGYIQFPAPGTYQVTCLVAPPEVAALTDAPEIHSAYHPCIVMYLAAHAAAPEDKALQADFLAYADAVNRRLSNMRLRGLRLPARMWR